MLRQISIRGYKSLRDITVSLSDLTVLFGPNASGKSNFLDALQLLSRIVQARTLKEAFEPPYRGRPLESFSFDDEGIEGLLRRETATFRFSADIELSPQVINAVNRDVAEARFNPEEKREFSTAAEPPTVLAHKERSVRNVIHERYLRYEVEIEVLPKSGLLRVSNENVAALDGKKLEVKRSRKAFLSRENDKLHLRLEGQAHPRYYDRYLDHTILSLPLYPPHYPHIVALRRELESWLFFYFEPRKQMRASNVIEEVRHIGLMGEKLAAFLNTLLHADKRAFHSIEKAIHAIIPAVDGIHTDVNKKTGEVELTIVEHGVPIPARVISEGTLRILGMLALAGSREIPGLIGLEEPENGVHPRRISMIADMLNVRVTGGAAQTIVTTHSPLLPDLISDKHLYVCRKIKRDTSIQPFSCWGTVARETNISEALEDIPPTKPSERMLRGDFDA